MNAETNINSRTRAKEKEFQKLTMEIGQLAIKHYQDRAESTEKLMEEKIVKAGELEKELLMLNQKAGLE